MGRPLKPIYFGKFNPQGVGGEGVASVTLGGTNDSSGYTTGDAVTFAAPQISGGATATGTAVANALGFLTAVTVTSAGSGYTSAPAVTAGTGTLGNLTLTAVINSTSTTGNAINMTAYLSTADGGSSAVASDIVAQKGSKRYRVKNAQGTGVVALVDNGSPTAGQGYIGATDSAGGTYYVYKLYDRTAYLTPNTGTQFAANTHVQWNITSPTVGVSVTIDNN